MMKWSCLLLGVIFGCSAYTPKNVVNDQMIETLKGKPFRLHSVRVPCNMGCSPVMYGTSSQKKLLQAIKPNETAKLFGDQYGMTVASENSLEMNSNIIHFTGLLTESAGRCFYMDDSSKYDNIIDIEIKALATCNPFAGNKVELMYDIEFSAGGKTVLRKYGEIAKLENKGVLFFGTQDFMDNVEVAVKKLPLIIQKDIELSK